MRVDEGLVVVVFAFGQNCKAAAFPCICSMSTSVSVFLHFLAGLCFLVIPLGSCALLVLPFVSPGHWPDVRYVVNILLTHACSVLLRDALSRCVPSSFHSIQSTFYNTLQNTAAGRVPVCTMAKRCPGPEDAGSSQ